MLYPRQLITTLSVFTCLLFQATTVEGWLSPITFKGNKFFNMDTGEEFRMKGMAYYPRPNAGEFSGVTGVDWTTDDQEAVWTPHIAAMKDLGVNTIRLYSVDPSKSHDKFMCAASEAGIYVLVGMAAPCENCAVGDFAPPKCYSPELLTRAQMIYNAFAVYDNTLGFSVGNENNLPSPGDKTGKVTAPCVKAFLRDTKQYARTCAGIIRQVPIGLDLADILPREEWLQYYDCVVDSNPLTSADWLGFNPYVECDPATHKTYAQSTGLKELMAAYKTINYSRPLMFGEFGCNKGENTLEGYENQRGFYDAKWMNEESEMTTEIVGGNVFEFSTEIANLAGTKAITTKADEGRYGVGFFKPPTCDHSTTKCVFEPYPEYKNLKTAYTTTTASTVKMSSFTPSRNRVLACPSGIETSLPSTPKVETLACSALQPVCSGKKSNNGNANVKGRKKDDRLTANGSGPIDNSTDSTGGTSGGGGTTGSNGNGNSTPQPSAANDLIVYPLLLVVSGIVALWQ